MLWFLVPLVLGLVAGYFKGLIVGILSGLLVFILIPAFGGHPGGKIANFFLWPFKF